MRSVQYISSAEAVYSVYYIYYLLYIYNIKYIHGIIVLSQTSSTTQGLALQARTINLACTGQVGFHKPKPALNVVRRVLLACELGQDRKSVV